LKHLKRIGYFTFPLFLLLLILELGLRFSGQLKTYTEQNFGYYQSPYGQVHQSHLFKFKPSEKLEYTQKEFSYTYLLNNEGFNDPKNLEDCQPEYTKIVLGDSFTFGVGAPQDSNMVALLNMKIDSIYFFNAGMPDSDPFYQTKLITDYFLPKGYKNFIIIINVSDIYDYIFRGGEERFKEDGTVVYRKAPSIQFWYQRFFLVRAFSYVFFDTDYTMLPKKTLKAEKENAVEALTNALISLNKTIENKGGSLEVVFHPYPAQFKKGNSKVYQEVLNYQYLEEIYKNLVLSNVNSFNLEPDFSKVLNHENYENYAWKIDGHFNGNGYDLYAKILFNQLGNYFEK